MIFEQIATGGCQSYLVGCPDSCTAVLIDPEIRQVDRYLASAARDGLRIRYLIDTLHVNDGDMLAVGSLRLQVIHTPGHTRDSMCIQVDDRLFTGDTLLIGATGRTDLPTGDADALYDSLFNGSCSSTPRCEFFPRTTTRTRVRRRSRARPPTIRASKSATAQRSST